MVKCTILFKLDQLVRIFSAHQHSLILFSGLILGHKMLAQVAVSNPNNLCTISNNIKIFNSTLFVFLFHADPRSKGGVATKFTD
jgi:hypothetical protein